MPNKTITFSGKGRAGDLSDANNWIRGAAPSSNDNAIITMDVGGPVSGIVTVNNMMLLGPETITFTGTLNTVGLEDCHGLMICDGATAIFAPGASLHNNNVVVVGQDAVGSLVAQGNGALRSTIGSVTAVIGRLDEGVGTVTINDADWTNSTWADIGEFGAGTLNVINNAAVKFGTNLWMGFQTGSHGVMTLSNSSSVVVTGSLWEGGAAARGVASVSVGTGSTLAVGTILTVGTGSTLTLSGGTATVADLRLVPGGVISGYGTLSAPLIENNGEIVASGGNLQINGSGFGAGSIDIAANSTATLTGASLKFASMSFLGSNGTLALAHGSSVGGAITGFSIGDMITMANVDALSFNATNGRLTLSEAKAPVESLHLTGSFAGEVFALHQTTAGAVVTLQHI